MEGVQDEFDKPTLLTSTCSDRQKVEYGYYCVPATRDHSDPGVVLRTYNVAAGTVRVHCCTCETPRSCEHTRSMSDANLTSSQAPANTKPPSQYERRIDPESGEPMGAV